MTDLIYAEELSSDEYGYALWQPGSDNKYNVVGVGDVGLIR
jgi:hypothetical protein